MLSITVENAQQSLQHTHDEGPLLIGREPNTPGGELVIDDRFVSRRQILLNCLDEGYVRLENLGVNKMSLSDRTLVARGESVDVALPVVVGVGKTKIEITIMEEAESLLFDDPDDSQFETISAPARRQLELGRSEQLSEAPSSEELARWFETLIAVQKSAFGTDEFYQETARALVELVGLDRGLVLLKEAGGWKVKSGHARTDQVPLSYSRSLIAQVLHQERTLFGSPEQYSNQASLVNLESVVASPIFDSAGRIIGILYGSRDFKPTMVRFGIQPLEAQVVQLLACSVSTGFAREEMQKKLQQMEQMAAVGQAIGYIIHDLRGPLGNIQQLLELSDKDSGLDEAERRKLIDHALAGSMDLLNDTLEFSRGTVRIKRQRGPIKKLMEQHLRLFELVAEGFGVELNFDIPENLVAAFDPDRMARVLRNLVKNAAEALQGQPDGRVELRAARQDDNVLLIVADNGPGLPEVVQENLFQPFGTHGKAGGTGFGLAIAKQLVEAHNGEIDVASDETGTQFVISLPQPSETEHDTDTSPQDSEDFSQEETSIVPGSLRVLLADDSLVNQRLISSYLASEGFMVTTANNGKEAVRRNQDEQFDVVLMDIEMPVLDGLEASRRIRQSETRRRTPIVAVTAHDEEAMHEKFREAGMDAFLVKPVRIVDLMRIIAKLSK